VAKFASVRQFTVDYFACSMELLKKFQTGEHRRLRISITGWVKVAPVKWG